MTSLYYNGNIDTVDPLRTKADAFVVRDGRFVYVGSQDGALDYLKANGPTAENVDLGGHFVLPAFHDSHMHFVHFAQGLFNIRLNGTVSIEEIRNRVRAGIAKRKPGDTSWLEGEGWNQDLFREGGRRFPNRSDLDDITGDTPVLLMRSCFHIGVLNSAGLKAIGLNRHTVSQYGDLAEVFPDGEPNGVIKENLLDRTKARISTLTSEALKKILIAAQNLAFAQGLTCLQTDDFGYLPDADYDMFFQTVREMTEAGQFRLNLGEQCLLQKADEIRQFFAKGYRYGGSKKLRVNCVKLLSDGSLGARTAALRHPYYDCAGTSGLASFTQGELNELVGVAHQNHCPVAIHAIGDRAIEMALDAIEYAQKEYPQIRLRDGIVHCQITDAGLLDRFRDLDVLAFVQPIFIDSDMNIVESRVGPDLAETSYAWKSLMDRGVHISFGSDCPVESFNTMPNLYSAVSRKNVTGDAAGKKVYLAGEKVSMAQAIRAYTLESAYAEGMENERGSITAGKIADFIVLDKNPFHIRSEEEILDIHVLKTYVDGTVVYQR